MLPPQDNQGDLCELARLRAAIEASGDIVYDWDLATDCVTWTGTAGGLFDPEPREWPTTAEALQARISPEDLPNRMRALSEHLAGLSGYDCEYRVRSDLGEFHWVHDRGAVQLSCNGTPERMVGSLRMVTRRKQREARLEYLANFDDLTGHFNKLRLREALDHALSHSIRFSQPGAFVVIGVDQMGMLNTAYGYEAGDKILISIGQRLDRCLRASDVVGRLGGDRFGILMTACDEEQALRAAERVLQIVRQSPIEIEGRSIGVTVSAAIVMFPSQSKTSFDVITKTESTLLQAKTAGRDCLSLYQLTEEQRQTYRASMDIGEAVKLALKEDRLFFAYQPVVDAKTHKVRFYECLLRMRSPEGDLIAAAQFVPHVEQLGLMRTIDRRALDLAIGDLQANPDITLALNISGLTAADRSWLRALIARLKGFPEIAERLIVEITETAALHDIEDSARFVSAVRDLGCQVAVDDFGAGYTTFKHLKSLTVDVVKIDGSFVRDIANSPENQIFLRNLLSLAQTFGLSTVAEFVETEEDAAYLAAQNVDYLQGYLFGRPDIAPPWKADEENPLLVSKAG